MAEPRPWDRVGGAFSHQVPASGPCTPTVGVSSYICACCGDRYVVVACVGDDGAELSVTLPVLAAVQLSDALIGKLEVIHDGALTKIRHAAPETSTSAAGGAPPLQLVPRTDAPTERETNA